MDGVRMRLHWGVRKENLMDLSGNRAEGSGAKVSRGGTNGKDTTAGIPRSWHIWVIVALMLTRCHCSGRGVWT